MTESPPLDPPEGTPLADVTPLDDVSFDDVLLQDDDASFEDGLPFLDPFPDNAAYLEAELERLDALLRLRLAALQRPLQVRMDAGGQGLAVSHEHAEDLLRQDPGAPEKAPDEHLLRRRAVTLDRVVDARIAASLASGVDLRLPRLRRVFQLSELEARALLICLAPELRRKYDTIYAFLQDDITRQRPSVDLVLNLLCDDEADRWGMRALFSPTAPLVRYGLLRTVDDPHSPSGSSGLARFLELDPRILHFLLNHPTLDERLRDLMSLWAPREDAVDACEDPRAERLADLAAELFSEPDTCAPDTAPHTAPDTAAEIPASGSAARRLVVHLHGAYGAGRRDLAQAVCVGLGRPLLVLDAARLPDVEDEARALLRLALRESVLFEAPLYLDGVDALTSETRGPARLLDLARAHEQLGWMLFLSGDKPWTRTGLFSESVFHSLGFATPPVPVRESVWQRSLEPLGAPQAVGEAAELARRFRLTPGQIRDAAVAADRQRTLRGTERPLSGGDLVEACRERSTLKLGELAVRVRPRHGWGDLVLPAEKRDQLTELVAQVTNRYRVFGEWGFGGKLSNGQAVSALFSGPPGTGKTLAAEVLAGELGLDLYKIDLSRVVSKYIGETEKNLSRIFDEAERGNVVLFFDEADALFGKRTEVSDAHDRYANIETSYLLQKMEDHDGVVILASNLRGNMDDAFLRRLRAVVEFPFPDPDSRAHIWRAHFPAAAPVGDDVDCDLLADKLRLAGGHIKNIVMSAAFFAASDGGVIRMEHIVSGARRELEKIGRSWDEQSLFGNGGN